MENHSTIVFLGNGYDVAYGYDTRYGDFYKDELFEELCNKSNLLAKFIDNANKEKGKNKEQEKGGEQDDGSKWSDLEEELYNYSRDLTRKNKNGDPPNLKLCKSTNAMNLQPEQKLSVSAKNFYEDFQQLQDYLGRFILKKTDNSQPHHYNNYQDLKNLTNDWLDEDESALVVSFNYTNVFWGTHTSANILYVHGSIHELQPKTRGSLEMEPTGRCLNHNIVLGIDEAMEVETAHSFLYKAYNEPTNIHHLSTIFRNAKRYIIFGCSLGETDRWYFENIFNKEQADKTYEIYHYKATEQLNINSRIKDISKSSIADFKERNNVLYLDSSDIKKAIEKRREYYKRFPFNP